MIDLCDLTILLLTAQPSSTSKRKMSTMADDEAEEGT